MRTIEELREVMADGQPSEDRLIAPQPTLPGMGDSHA